LISLSSWLDTRAFFFECACELKDESSWQGVWLYVLGYGCSQVYGARWIRYINLAGIIVFQLKSFSIIYIEYQSSLKCSRSINQVKLKSSIKENEDLPPLPGESHIQRFYRTREEIIQHQMCNILKCISISLIPYII
jgi:hypothetical protein